MRVWFTRPELWDCIVKGIGRCHVWLAEPVFDTTPIGSADPLFPHNPVGWTVKGHGADAYQMSQRVDGCLKHYPEIATVLFEAMSFSIDGKAPREGVYDDWTRLLDDPEYPNNGHCEFVLPMEVPPELWWTLARNASKDALAYAHRQQSNLTSDFPF